MVKVAVRFLTLKDVKRDRKRTQKKKGLDGSKDWTKSTAALRILLFYTRCGSIQFT